MNAPSPAEMALFEAVGMLAPQINACRDQIEHEGHLPRSLVQSLVEAGMFRMNVPRDLGGIDAGPFTFAAVIEQLARIDASVAWCVMVPGQESLGAARLPDQGARDIFADPNTIVAGVAAPTGQAIAVEGGYRMSGRWSFASGCQHATWLHGGCVVFDGDRPKLGANGMPETRALFLPASEGQIIETWDTTGLRGTGSHDFTVTNVFVPRERSFDFMADPPRYAGAQYHVPALPFLPQATLALGIARGASDAFGQLAQVKTALGSTAVLREQATVQERVAEAEALTGAGRAFLYEAAGDLLGTFAVGQEPALQQRARLRLAMSHAVANAVQAVDLMYSAAGSSAIYRQNPLDHHFRDIHTAAAHWTVSPRLYEATGRIFLGLEPSPVFF